MIELNSMQLGKERAAQFAAVGTHLRAVVNTPLVELVNFTTPTILTGNDDDYSFAQVSDNGEHNARLEGLADFLAETVSRHIDYARNVVTPALEQIMTQTTEAVVTLQVDPQLGVSVQECGYPPIFDLEQFQTAIDRYNTGTNVIPVPAFKYPAYSDQQIIEACHTGSANIDKLMGDWLSNLPMRRLQSIWQSVFQDKVGTQVDADILSTEALIKDFDNGLDNAVVIFLLAERLSQDIGTDCGLELQEAKEAFLGLRAATVTAIKFAMQRYENFSTTNTIVMGFDRATRQVRVNRGTYRAWIAEGGKIETLLGYFVMGKMASTKAEIEAGQVEALDAWNWHARLTQAEQDTKFVGDVKAIACDVFARNLETMTSEVEKEAIASIANAMNMNELFRTLIMQATPDQIRKNYIDVVWRAACQARFYYTGAYAFLSEMNYEINERAMDPADAATMATITYISSYIAGMVEIA